MHYVKKNNVLFGFEVTVSHNPSNYNVIKVIAKAKDESIALNTFDEGIANGYIEYLENPFNDFLYDILGVFDCEAIRNRGLRILFDPMHGPFAYTLLIIFHTIRCTVDIISLRKLIRNTAHLLWLKRIFNSFRTRKTTS